MFFTMANGNALAFGIKAYASEAELLADTPAEYTIGVEAESIDSYVISATEPENPTVNMLWIQIDGDSPVKFPATGKQNLFLHPVKSYIYHTPEDDTDTGWDVVVSYLYMNSKWNVFGRQYLYRSGKFVEDITGGFNTGYMPYSSGDLGSIDVKEEADHLLLDASQERWGSAATRGAVFAFKNFIDLTNYKTITFEGYNDKENSNSNVYYGVWAQADGMIIAGGGYKESAITYCEKTEYSTDPVVLNVKSLSGEYLVGVGMRSCKVRIDNCYLEM